MEPQRGGGGRGGHVKRVLGVTEWRLIRQGEKGYAAPHDAERVRGSRALVGGQKEVNGVGLARCRRNGLSECTGVQESRLKITRMRCDAGSPPTRPPMCVQPVKSPVSNPGLVMRFAEAGWANERAAAAVKVSRILVGAFMPDLAA